MATLEQLDGKVWETPQTLTSLIRKCLALRKKDLNDFTPEDLRVMLGQEFCANHLAPLALRVLQTDPFAQGALYPGDLLAASLRPGNWSALNASEGEWIGVCENFLAVAQVAENNVNTLPDDRSVSDEIILALRHAVKSFLNQ